MNTSFAPTAGVVPSPAHQEPATVDIPATVAIPQYGIRRILAVWAAAALPMGALAWLVAPALKDSFAGTGSVQMAKALIVCLTAGLIWQFVLVVALLRREQGTLRWSTTRDALWLRSPQSPRSGRVGGRIWLILVPLILAATFIDGVPFVNGPSNRDFGTFHRLTRRPRIPQRRLGLVRTDPGLAPVQHRAGRGAALPRIPAPAHEPCLRPRRLARQRRAVRPIPPARAVGDAVRAARHVHLRLPDQALPKRMDRHRRPQRLKRVLGDRHPHARRVTSGHNEMRLGRLPTRPNLIWRPQARRRPPRRTAHCATGSVGSARSAVAADRPPVGMRVDSNVRPCGGVHPHVGQGRGDRAAMARVTSRRPAAITKPIFRTDRNTLIASSAATTVSRRLRSRESTRSTTRSIPF